jgi:hypothetical protein
MEITDALVMTPEGMRATGSIAQRLMDGGFKANTLRTNSTLRKDEWKEYDKALVQAAVRPMRAVAALRSMGLTFSIGNGMAKTVLEYEDVSDMSDAQLSIDGETQGDNDRVVVSIKYLPLPIISKPWFLGARTLAAARLAGGGLDTTQTETAGRKCGETLEDMLLNGTGASPFSFGGGTIYGLTDHPSRNTLAMGTDWASATGKAIKDDILEMIRLAQLDLFYGPYTLFVSSNCQPHMGDDYSSNYSKTILARVREIEGISRVEYCPFLNKSYASSQAILVQATPDVVRLVDGMPMTNVQWEEQGNMRFHFKGMMISVPQIRARQDGTCGIVHCKAGL